MGSALVKNSQSVFNGPFQNLRALDFIPVEDQILTSTLDPNKHIGTFPVKGTYIHHYFSRIYLDAYVFRGLRTSSTSQTPVIPQPFVETASAAVTAAVSIVNIILEDVEVQIGLAGVPHYFYGMIAFACVFLVKAAAKHSAQLFINQQETQILIEKLSNQLSATQVGRGHVIHRMAAGLRKMAESLGSGVTQQPVPAKVAERVSSTQSMDYASGRPAGPMPLDATSFSQFPSMDGTDVGFGESNLGFGMPFFDFEGNNIDMSSPVFLFPM